MIEVLSASVAATAVLCLLLDMGVAELAIQFIGFFRKDLACHSAKSFLFDYWITWIDTSCSISHHKDHEVEKKEA